VVGNSNKGKKCQKRIKKGDENRKIYEFCARSCQKCKPKAKPAPKSTLEPKATLAPKSTPEPKPTPAPTSGVSLKEYQKQLDIFKKSIDDQHRDIEKLREKLWSQDALLNKVQGHVDTLENTVVRSCSQDSDCADPNHFCFNGWCSIAECRDSDECTDYNNPFCDSGACIQCNGRSCTAQQPYCVNDNCAECRRNDDCPEAAHPYCSNDTCVECVQNSDCGAYGTGACDTISGNCYNYQSRRYCDGGRAIGWFDHVVLAIEACTKNGTCGCFHSVNCDGTGLLLTTGTETIRSDDKSFGYASDYDTPCAWVKT
jgi:hypothetical protein